MKGIIDWVSPDRRYGCLRDDDGRAVALRQSELDTLSPAVLVVGQRVEFDLAPDTVIAVAAGVRPIYQCGPCRDSGCGWCDWPR
jgi:cold shock CspA family protein